MPLADERGIARAPAELRIGARVLLRQGKDRGLVAFRIADTHVHALVVGSRVEAGKLALYAETCLRRHLRIPIPFERCRVRPIDNERHLLHALRYIFRQEAHHGTAFDEAHDGSSLPDLLGLRLGAAWIASRVRRLLPRLKRGTLMEWLGVPALHDVEPDLRLLADAAAAAWGVPTLHGGSVAHVRARRAAVQLLDRLVPGASALDLRGLHPRSIARYRSQPVNAADLNAVEQQLKLRALLRARVAAGVDWPAQLPG